MKCLFVSSFFFLCGPGTAGILLRFLLLGVIPSLLAVIFSPQKATRLTELDHGCDSVTRKAKATKEKKSEQ